MAGQLPPPDPTAQPRYDFSNQGTLGGLLREFQTHLMRNMENMLPATVIAYDRTNNVASVQPQIHMVTTDGKLVGRGSVASVPVLALGGGGFLMTFPLVAGSRGWIKSNDRDISLYMQSSTASAPNTQRMHSFSDGLFIPDVVNGYTLNGEDAEAMVIQNLAGTVRIALFADHIKMSAPMPVIIDAPDLIINGKSFNMHEHVNGGGTGNSGIVA